MAVFIYNHFIERKRVETNSTKTDLNSPLKGIFMISDNLSFINTVNDKSLTEYINTNTITFYVCPKCGSTHIVRNGHYMRKIAHLDDEDSIITIQKLLCKDCHTSFKEFPKNISSFNRYSIISIIKILFNKDSINSLYKKYYVARNTIKRYLKRFKDVRNKIDVLLRKVNINSFDELIIKYLDDYRLFLFEPSTSNDSILVYVFKIT